MKAKTMGKFLSVLCSHILRKRLILSVTSDAAATTNTTTTSTTSRIVSAWLAINLMMVLLCGEVVTATASNLNSTEEDNMQYKEYWYRTEQLCPDIQESLSAKEIDTANYPYKTVYRFVEHLPFPYSEMPCYVETSGPQRIVSKGIIVAVHMMDRPWNFSEAMKCDEHIKLRLPERTFLKRSNVPKIICKIYRPHRPKAMLKKETSSGTPKFSLYNPFLWEFQKSKLGISFPSFNLSHIDDPPPRTRNSNATLSNSSSQYYKELTDKRKAYWLEPDQFGSKYVQIVFITHTLGECSIRVQQYLVDQNMTLCNSPQRIPFTLCGVYDCSKMQDILNAMGFWWSLRHQEIDMILRTDFSKWRREPGYLEIFVKTVRALLMPLFFLGVFYFSRKLRVEMTNRSSTSSRTLGLDRHRRFFRQRQCYLRNFRCNNHASADLNTSDAARPSLILNHAVFDIPIGEEFVDPPPPYEYVVQPPTYLEAMTTTSKPTPSPVDNPTTNQSTISIPDSDNNNTEGNAVNQPENATTAVSSSGSSPQQENSDEEMVALISSPNPENLSPEREDSRYQSSSSNLHLST